MTILVTSDLHLSPRPSDADRWGALKAVIAQAHKHRVSHAFILGDGVDSADEHPGFFVNNVVDALASFPCPVTWIMGNHEAADPLQPYWRFLNYIPNLDYIYATTSMRVEGLTLLLVPYHQWMEHPTDDTDFILCHHTFEGALADNGFALAGRAVPKTGPRIISGDVHVPQTLGRAVYVGAPTTIKYGDAYKPRILLIKEGKLLTVPLVTPARRVLVAYASSDGALRFDRGTVNPGDLVKVKVHFPAGIPPLLPLRQDIAKHVEGLGAELEAVLPQIEHRTVAMAQPEAELDDDGALVERYADAHNLPEPSRAVARSIIKDRP